MGISLEERLARELSAVHCEETTIEAFPYSFGRLHTIFGDRCEAIKHLEAVKRAMLEWRMMSDGEYEDLVRLRGMYEKDLRASRLEFTLCTCRVSLVRDADDESVWHVWRDETTSRVIMYPVAMLLHADGTYVVKGEYTDIGTDCGYHRWTVTTTHTITVNPDGTMTYERNKEES